MKKHNVILISIASMSGIILLLGIILTIDILLTIGIASFISIIFSGGWNFYMDYVRRERDKEWKKEDRKEDKIEELKNILMKTQIHLEKGTRVPAAHSIVLDLYNFISNNIGIFPTILEETQYQKVEEILDYTSNNRIIGKKQPNGKWSDRTYSLKIDSSVNTAERKALMDLRNSKENIVTKLVDNIIKICKSLQKDLKN
ncbi:MAG: hypothetical protein H7645_01270 [Candidatus Heimdallarchaeota archaeon]|nr:hypothetical protein [Candidatus Heimdallarchaeota archaeon]MCK4768946.1 hypothetical protein [Candidatus Heimdallarchaeota archaeon]